MSSASPGEERWARAILETQQIGLRGDTEDPRARLQGGRASGESRRGEGDEPAIHGVRRTPSCRRQTLVLSDRRTKRQSTEYADSIPGPQAGQSSNPPLVRVFCALRGPATTIREWRYRHGDRDHDRGSASSPPAGPGNVGRGLEAQAELGGCSSAREGCREAGRGEGDPQRSGRSTCGRRVRARSWCR